MNTYEDFEKYLNENQDAFKLWGLHVSKKITDALENELGEESFRNFIKITATPRVKEIQSALGKVARKGYEDPITQMTDLVGTRFVVLLSKDIDLVCNIIEKDNEFIAKNSKNYLDEIDLNPKIFDYQSRHYEVRPKEDMVINDIEVSKSICCEVQVRTLLQHAYAELVHDNVYKPVGNVPKAAERQIARSMALMETTDDLFCTTMELLCKTNSERNNFKNALSQLYVEFIGSGYSHYDDATNLLILDSYKSYIDHNTETRIRELFQAKKFLSKKVRIRATSKTLYAQPCVLFVYILINSIPLEEVFKTWPLPGYIPELEMAFSDLGLSSNR